MDSKTLKRHLTDVYVIAIVGLLILIALGSLQIGIIVSLPRVIVAVAVAVAVDIIFVLWKRGKIRFPKTALITGLFIGGLIDPTAAFYVIAIAALAAIISKNLIKYKSKTVFNPASFGLLFTFLVFRVGLAWWVASNIIVIIVLGIIVAYKLKRFELVATYLIVYYAAYYFVISHSLALSPVVLFFSMMMLTEPKTTPAHSWSVKVIYGAIVAILSVAFAGLLGASAFIAALLIGNLIGLLMDHIVKKRRSSKQPLKTTHHVTSSVPTMPSSL